jgi:hypothetical protein
MKHDQAQAVVAAIAEKGVAVTLARLCPLIFANFSRNFARVEGGERGDSLQQLEQLLVLLG